MGLLPPLDGAGEALLERDLGPPVEELGRPGDVGHPPPRVLEPGPVVVLVGVRLDARLRADRVADHLRELQDRGLVRVPEVDDLALGLGGEAGEERAPHGVGDVGEAAALPAVAVHASTAGRCAPAAGSWRRPSRSPARRGGGRRS